MEELIAVVDEKDEVVDIRPISEVHKQGLIHREAYVCLINSKKEVLLQRRKDNGLWDHSAAGHFSENESYIQAAKREFGEELGVELALDELEEIGYARFDTIKPGKKNFRFVKIYLVRKDISSEDFKLDSNEVIEVKFFNRLQLQKLFQQSSILPDRVKAIINKYVLDKM
jgi:isopentenyldiphosphate isomerase